MMTEVLNKKAVRIEGDTDPLSSTMIAAEFESEIDDTQLQEESTEEESKPLRASVLSVSVGLHDDVKQNMDEFPMDLSALACVMATDPANKSVFSCISPIIFATVFTWIKILIVANILADAVMKRCSSHDQCKDGTACVPVNIFFVDKPIVDNIAFCNDCNIVNTFLNTTTSEDHPQRDIVLEALDRCKEDDPDICDFIMENRALMSPLTVVLLFLIWAMFSMLVHYDLRKVRSIEKLMEIRMSQMENGLNVNMLAFVNWFFFASLSYVFPSWMTIATAILIVAYPPEARSLIIVPLEIALIANFDDVMKFLFLGNRQVSYIQDAAKILVKNDPEAKGEQSDYDGINLDRIYSVVLRLYSYALGTAAVLFAVYPEKVHSRLYFMYAFVGFQEQFLALDPCAEIVVGAIYLPLILTGPLAAFFTLLEVLGTLPDNRRLFLVRLLNVPTMFIIVVYSWLPIYYLLRNFQYDSL